MTDLVIGYGNTLRGDDGVGYRAAAEISRWNVPNVYVTAVPQLTPELASQIAGADRVFFLDADIDPTRRHIQVISLAPNHSNPAINHYSDPSALLSLCQSLYGRLPESLCILIPAIHFDITEELSQVAQDGQKQALDYILNLFYSHV